MLIRWRGQMSLFPFLSPDDMRNRAVFSGFVFKCLLVLCVIGSSIASHGDQCIPYQSCLGRCVGDNCSTSGEKFLLQRPWYLSALDWDCLDECRYGCMWHALEFLESVGEPVPQFHGKWPFLRMYGIQEPASTLFSLLNGLSHVWMWHKFCSKVPQSAPNYLLWNGQALLSINAWFWSTIFHARDTPVTEKLDYFCAFSLVLYSLYSLCIRILGRGGPFLSVPFVAFFAYHIHYLAFVHFDYGYNMLANVVAGLLSSVGWLAWCKWHRRPYVWRCIVVTVAVNVLLLLELGDFPPWMFILDAHALWHLGTVPLPFLWYRFLIDDSLYELIKARSKVNRGCPSCENHKLNLNAESKYVIENGNHAGKNKAS